MKSRTIRRAGIQAISVAVLLAACNAAPGPSVAPGSPAETEPEHSAAGTLPLATPSTTRPERNVEVDLPEGWQASDLDPASLTALADALQADWPAVSQGLRAVAAGAPGPFHEGTTFLAYSLRPADLADYPTGMNVVEIPWPGDVACDAASLAEEVGAAGLSNVSREAVSLPFGPAWRVRYTFPSGRPGIDLAGETWALSGSGASYQPYFETLASRRAQFQPVFEGIMRSFRERTPTVEPSPAPGMEFVRYPHDAPALEALMPTSALGRPLCVWSASGSSAAAIVGKDATRILGKLGLPDAAFGLAVAGRASTTLDPPYIVSAWQFDGATSGAIAGLFGGWPPDRQERVAGQVVYLLDIADSPGHAEGQGYQAAIGNRIYNIQTRDPAWMRDVVTQIAALSGE